MERHLDTLVLRTFLAAAEHGEFAAAARVVGRTQGTVSLQIKKLEEILGQVLFERGRNGVTLTPAGVKFAGFARRILDEKDAALAELRDFSVSGALTVGITQDFAFGFLPWALRTFARTHPNVALTIKIDRNDDVIARVASGQIDLALVFGTPRGPGTTRRIGHVPTVWITSGADEPVRGGALTIVASEAPCVFREAALQALDRAGRRYQVSFTSASLQGLFSGTAAGFGVMVRTPLVIPPDLRTVSAPVLPALAPLALSLIRPAPTESAAAARLSVILKQGLRDRVPLVPDP